MSDNRRFHYALLASVALHVLALFTFRDVIVDTARRAASIPPQIIARLMEPEPPPTVEEVPLARLPEKPKPKPKPKPRAIENMRPAPAAPPESAMPLAPAREPETEAKAEAAPQPPQPLAAFEPPPAAPASQPPSHAPEALSRDQYRLQLTDEARRHKRYPPLARENNWQGDVVVAVLVAPNGRSSVSLKASSGYEVLDRQALDMFKEAVRAVPVPPPLRGKEFSVELRAVYSLEDRKTR